MSVISKLPMRQLTKIYHIQAFTHISKLPMRQLTQMKITLQTQSISKLPMRQLTLVPYALKQLEISKLPMRQLTDAGAEKEADSTCAYTSFSHFDPNLFLP